MDDAGKRRRDRQRIVNARDFLVTQARNCAGQSLIVTVKK
jgi:hypothetical protein